MKLANSATAKSAKANYFANINFARGNAYEVRGLCQGDKLHVCGNVALALTREGKTNAAIATTAILSDKRFDFSEAFIISVGCAGTCFETTTMGDVIIGSAVIDGDSGHTILENGQLKWFPLTTSDKTSFKLLNQKLVVRALELAKNVPVKTTEKTRAFMRRFNPQLDREPQIFAGTIFTSDNYWKGEDFHNLAKKLPRTTNVRTPTKRPKWKIAPLPMSRQNLACSIALSSCAFLSISIIL